jgi:magnesium-transporting ATPase (P-type)
MHYASTDNRRYQKNLKEEFTMAFVIITIILSAFAIISAVGKKTNKHLKIYSMIFEFLHIFVIFSIIPVAMLTVVTMTDNPMLALKLTYIEICLIAATRICYIVLHPRY